MTCPFAHFEKMAHLHSRQAEKRGNETRDSGSGDGGGGSGGASGGTTTAHPTDLRLRLFCTLMRYQALGGHGSQCAVPPGCFDVLAERLEVAMECFASPMNTRCKPACNLRVSRQKREVPVSLPVVSHQSSHPPHTPSLPGTNASAPPSPTWTRPSAPSAPSSPSAPPPDPSKQTRPSSLRCLLAPLLTPQPPPSHLLATS